MADFVPLKEMPGYLDMLEDLLMIEEGLTDKEVDFIDNLPNWKGCFTVPQAEWLERLWNRLCG